MSGFLVSGGAPATARWKAALLSLLVSEEALQGLDKPAGEGLVCVMGFDKFPLL